MGDDNLLPFPRQSRIPPTEAEILGSEVVKTANELLVIGQTPEGRIFISATSASVKDNLYLLKVAEYRLIAATAAPTLPTKSCA